MTTLAMDDYTEPRPTCALCGKPCEVRELPIEIGAAWWAAQGIDCLLVSDCCHVAVIEDE